MKKAFVFLYSRTFEKDYRPIASINDPVFPNELSQRVEARATGLLRATDKQLEDPQWLFMKEGSCVIWGIACMNKLLDERYGLDKTDTPIRCFMALVIPNYNGESLPLEKNAFVLPFCEVMDELFTSYRTFISNVTVDLPVSKKCVSPGIWNENLNTDIRCCKFFANNVDSLSLLRAAIGYKGDISIAFNVAKEECVNDKKLCPPMNAVMRINTSISFTETGLRLPAPIIPDVEEEMSNDSDDKDFEEPKTDNYWTKIAILFSILVILFAIIYCVKRPTNRTRLFNIPNTETHQQKQIRTFIDDSTVINATNDNSTLSKKKIVEKSVSNERLYDTVSMIAR